MTDSKKTILNLQARIAILEKRTENFDDVLVLITKKLKMTDELLLNHHEILVAVQEATAAALSAQEARSPKPGGTLN